MAISFSDSLKKSTSALETVIPHEEVSTQAVVISEEYTLCTDGRYEIYTQYFDSNCSTVDNLKNITVDAAQVNITQETNSQYIPFMIPRYWDGIDLLPMLIQFHYSNKDGTGGISNAVNVRYNNDTIVCAWLIDANVTAVAGDVAFEITATGVNEKGRNYIWKTRPNGKLTVLEALTNDGIVKPTDDWYTGFVNTMTGYVAEAKKYADSASASASSIDVEQIAANVTSRVNQQVNEELQNYYTKVQVDTMLGEIDGLKDLTVLYDPLSGVLTFKNKEKVIANPTINSLSNLKVSYAVTDGIGKLTFKNGELEITSVEIGNVNPSAEWTNALRSDITAEITSAVGKVDATAQESKEQIGTLNETVESIKTELGTAKENIGSLQTNVSEAKAEATEAKTTASSLKSGIDGNSEAITQLNNSVSALEEKVNGLPTSQGNVYDLTFEDLDAGTRISLLENDQIKSSHVVSGGGGGVTTSTITITRVTSEKAVFLQGNTVLIEYQFASVDNAGDTTGNGTATWRVGNTTVATSTAIQGKNSFDITNYLKAGENTIRLSIADTMGTIGTKTWTVTVVELKVESSFDDTLFYSGEVTFRYTPYGNISKQVVFKLDGKNIGGTTTSISGRQMTQTIPTQSHGSHLLEVYMTAVINDETFQSNSIYRDIIWIDSESSVPVIGCAMADLSVTQYNTVLIPYVVYDPTHNPATVTLAVDGVKTATLSVGRTEQTWSYKPTTAGKHTLTITCGETVKTISANVEELGIDVSPVTTNLAIDFNPSGKTNSDETRLWTDGTYHLTVSDNFDWSNGGYQIDEDGDTYFCVKAGTTAVIDHQLFKDDAKKTGKEFKIMYRCTNVRNYDAQVLSCLSGGIGVNICAQTAELKSEQNTLSTPYAEDNYMELEFNILPDNPYREMVTWIDGIPQHFELYETSDSFTQTSPVGITIGSDDCDVHIYRIKAYTMNLTDDEMMDNFIADAKNADEMINRYIRNNILDSSGNLDPDVLAEKCPDLRIIKIDTPRFTTSKKDKVSSTSFQQIYKNGRVVDNWISYDGIHNGQGTSSEHYGESGRNLELNCKNGFTFSDGQTAEKYSMSENAIPINYFNIKLNIASSENINNSYLANEFNRFNPHIRSAKKKDPRVRDTMEFHPCVVFIRETDIENAVEFKDGEWHFYGCGNIGNSKKNSEAFGMDSENHKEFIVEVSNNVDPQCRFLSDDLSAEGWDGDTSFEFRYSNPNCTEEEIQAGKDAWQALLTWVVNADAKEFVAHFEDHFVKDSLLFFYLFTERHTMVDNRAKNTFWHTEDLIHWDIDMDYDNDTAMGNDNEGGLTLTYGYEDTDTIGTKSVFNAADSKVWCMIRDNFQTELASMYQSLESKLAWSSNRILTEMEQEQAMKPERLWVADMRRKYFRTYEDNGTTSYIPMMNGDKKMQRRQFQKYQEKYIASKYVSATATADVITIRAYTPINWAGVAPDGTFHIVPYADTYVAVRFGSNLSKVRAKRGKTYDVKSTIAAMNDTEVYVYNASMIQSIGDIAPFYPGYTDFNQGIKLTDLTVGSGVSGYQNTNLSDFSIGNNVLLQHLNLQNLPNLKKAVSLEKCVSLIDFLADGSGITGVVLPTGGKLTTAHIPAITSLTGRNVYFLTDLQIAGFDNLVTLSLDNCPTIDILDFVNKAKNLSRARLIGIDWTLEDTTILDKLYGMAGIDENGYNTEKAVLSGSVHVPVMKERKLADYRAAWPDLDITYDTLINQFTVTFKNDNGDVLDVQYVDKGDKPVDPIKRKENPIEAPTKASTVEDDFTFDKWDTTFAAVFSNIIITATYKSSRRNYTIKYVAKGTVKQETKAPYGTNVLYTGDIPTYTAEETAYKYYLFTGWDQSGYVNGDKTINAVYDSCEYSQGYFDDKDLDKMKPVEIYALIKVGLETTVLHDKDHLSIELGHDYSYSDIEEHVLIDKKTVFNGSNYVDTELKLFEKDRDFVLAIDFSFDTTNSNNAVLAQCFQTNGMDGFKLWYQDSPKVTWGTASSNAATLGKREIIVLRHIKGENGLHVYNSNLSGTEVAYVNLNKARITSTDAPIVFGCSRADDGNYENYAVGTVYWSKVWFADLGEEACKQLATWTHEQISFEMMGLKRYYLSDNTSKRCALSFLAANLLSRQMALSTMSTNEGGWATCNLNNTLNTRVFQAFPTVWQQIIKKVKVSSSVGNMSSEITSSDCYLTIPSVYELDPSMTQEPYCYEGSPISWMTTNKSRRCAYDGGNNAAYWTRSPNIAYSTYAFMVDENGSLYGYFYPYNEGGIRLMFSI